MRSLFTEFYFNVELKNTLWRTLVLLFLDTFFCERQESFSGMMGEIAINSEVEMELQGRDMDVEAEMKSNEWNLTAGGGGSGALAEVAGGSCSERFLPGRVRVLLVESDDSTRQIIAALLRKCSYRVAAFSDGLKAWELLKGRPQSIELILTEVELPSISGYALLSLIMEHEVCKNIPVIMTSSHDSIGTVYKCMLRGAADFLVKPIRKNELMNLWQHVWRKQTSGTGTGPPDESTIQKKDETTAENQAVSNNSSGFMPSAERYKQYIKKESDAQSSWSKPELETEGEVEHDQCISPLKAATTYEPNKNNVSSPEKIKRQMDDDKNRDAGYTTAQAVNNPNDGHKHIDMMAESNHELEYSAREAIDLIGAIDNHLIGIHVISSSNGVNASPLLDLSLRRYGGYVNLVNNERSQLNHSNASPFSRYINKPVPQRNSTFPSICNEQKAHETNSEKQPSRHIALEYNFDTYGPATGSSKQCSVAVVQTQQHGNTFPCSQDREISHPIPPQGVEFDNLIGPHAAMMPSIDRAKPDSPQLPSPQVSRCSESLQEVDAFPPVVDQSMISQQFHSLVAERIRHSMDQNSDELENKDERELVTSPVNNHCINSSYHNGNMSHHPNIVSGSNEKISTISIINAPSECSNNEERSHPHEGSSHRSIQREAALSKFRLKRKERCFEKKVRYESRKKLAEQRPRIKGQFVRQLPVETQPGNSSAG